MKQYKKAENSREVGGETEAHESHLVVCPLLHPTHALDISLSRETDRLILAKATGDDHRSAFEEEVVLEVAGCSGVEPITISISDGVVESLDIDHA